VVENDSSSSSDAEEYDAVIDKDFAKTLLFNFGGPLQLEGK